MATDLPLYCIDTCIYIDWLTGDKNAPLKAIEDVILEIENKTANLLVPVIAYVEVMEAHHSGSRISQFRGFLKRSNISIVDITLPLADKAEALRSAAWRLKPKRNIRSTDAIFIAASILYGATMLLTRDDKLLGLSGHNVVDKLTITLPRTASGKQSIPGTVDPLLPPS
jgi:predicted nucleic acid-binding protein